MKLLIASDIHGAAGWCEKLMRAVASECPDRVVLLGDLLYHGPRNDVPEDYDPRAVIAQLSEIADKVIAVRGNCEAEVDQMVLPFACLAPYNVLYDPASGKDLFCTHGHVYGPGIHNSVDSLPRLAPGTAIVYGHTHRKVAQQVGEGLFAFNPGSVGIPKDGTHSYGLYEDGSFVHRMLA